MYNQHGKDNYDPRRVDKPYEYINGEKEKVQLLETNSELQRVFARFYFNENDLKVNERRIEISSIPLTNTKSP